MRIEEGSIHLPEKVVNPGNICSGCLYNSQGECCARNMILTESARSGNARAVRNKLTELVEDRALIIIGDKIFCPEDIFRGTIV